MIFDRRMMNPREGRYDTQVQGKALSKRNLGLLWKLRADEVWTRSPPAPRRTEQGPWKSALGHREAVRDCTRTKSLPGEKFLGQERVYLGRRSCAFFT